MCVLKSVIVYTKMRFHSNTNRLNPDPHCLDACTIHTDVEHYITIEKYTAEEQDELSFPKGVKVDVLQKSLDGWWLIKYEGKAALAPATFLVKETTKENSSVCGKRCTLDHITTVPVHIFTYGTGISV